MLKPESYPLVSIIIPNYNHARYLGDAIRSVLNQTFQDFEIIVVDDGSTDDSREVAAQFGGRVRYIWQENRGLSAARNTGIAASRGSFIGVLDADDMYEPDYLETLVAALEQNPQADGIYCGYQFVNHENKLLPQIEARAVPPEELHRALLDGNFLVPESMFVRRYCYETSGPFDETLRACEDWDMWLRFTKRYKIIHTTRILTRHRILPGSMSTDPLRMLTARLAVLRKHVGPEPVEGMTSTIIQRRAYARAYLGSCVEYLQYGDQDRAFECFQKMANIHPELLTELDTFYQLGCGNQPKGSMGDLESLDVRRSGLSLLVMLGSLFTDGKTNRRVHRFRNAAHATAYFALGMLAYGTRDFPEARRFLTRAMFTNPRLVVDRRLISRWVKSFLPATLVDRMRQVRQRSA